MMLGMFERVFALDIPPPTASLDYICFRDQPPVPPTNTLECEQLDTIQELFSGVAWERENTWAKYQQNLVATVIDRSHWLGNGGPTLI